MYRLLCLLASINLPLILILKTMFSVPLAARYTMRRWCYDVVNATVFFLCFPLSVTIYCTLEVELSCEGVFEVGGGLVRDQRQFFIAV